MSSLEQHLKKLIDPQFGLIQSLILLPRNPDEADIYTAIAMVQNPLSLPPQNEFTLRKDEQMKQGAGCGYTFEDCIWSTIGESVERYAAAIYDNKDLLIDCYRNISDKAVNPLDFIRFSEAQYAQQGFPYRPPQPDDMMGWVLGKNITTGKDMYIPASMVYMFYSPATETDGRIDNGYSTGLAAGQNYMNAIHSGLREVIERDAYALHWFTKRTAPKVDLAEIYNNAGSRLKRLLDKTPCNFDLRDYSTDLNIPCMLSHITSREFSGIASGSSCNSNPYKCAEKAILESIHTLNWCLDMQRSENASVNLEDIKIYEHHVRYYFDRARENKHNLDFMFAEGDMSDLDLTNDTSVSFDAKSDLISMVDKLEKRGYQVYVVDITTDDVRNAGFVVVRVLVPGLQPLYCGLGNEHLDTRRIEKFCTHMGMDLELPLNTNPHPFP